MRRQVKVLGTRLLERLMRLVVGPSLRAPAPASNPTRAEIVENADALNAAAERYFADYRDVEFLKRKPFSEPMELPRRFFDVGVLLHALRLTPGVTVAEVGAGSCWLCHFLNLYGCKTVAIDVSETALAIGRQVFEGDPHTDWSLEPEFVAYDGHRFPLEDASCDRIVLNDAFHHVPNQAEILGEMARILRPGGIVAMSEPGRRHSLDAGTQEEVRTTGVLENDIVVEAIERLALERGFSAVNVLPASLAAPCEVPASGLEAFIAGRGALDYWRRLAHDVWRHHYLVLTKGEAEITTRSPRTLAGEIEVLAPQGSARVSISATVSLRCTVRNAGDTLWLTAAEEPGWTRLGAHLRPLDGQGAEDRDWHRVALPADVRPGASVLVESALPALRALGRYRVELDLVVEGLCWFAHRGSRTAVFEFEVTP